MFSPIDDSTRIRMLAAHRRAADTLGRSPVGEPVWGWRGRTIGGKTIDAAGETWLRVQSAPANKADGKLWEGTEVAALLLPRLAKPRLLAIRDWEQDGYVYRAELTEFIADPVCSPDSVLRHELDLGPDWFAELRANLAIFAELETDRMVLSQEYLDRTMPQYLDLIPGRATQAPAWVPAHGDIHFANLTAPQLRLLDLEGFGLAPVGYDAATLYMYSLLAPRTAARIYAEFSDVLTSKAGRFAQLVVITELLQSCSRGDNLDLRDALVDRARVLLGPARQR